MSRIIVILLFTFFVARPQVQGNGILGSVGMQCSATGMQAMAGEDLYLIFYATHAGKTGHVGLAFDEQAVKVSDCAACPGGVRYDTVRTGKLIYFDLWPAEEEWTYRFFFGSVPAKYYRLPNSSAEAPITVSSLLRKGLPHAMKDAVDGLLKFPLSPTRNEALMARMQAVVDAGRPFNLYEFNCSDFVLHGLALVLPELTNTDEKVLARMATTPNRLWQAVATQANTIILKDPGAKATGRFNSQRIFTPF